MLLLMLESGMPIDCVITADTGMEFPEMYRHWDKIDQLLYQERGIGVLELYASDKYAQYISAMMQFHRYSFGNALLILFQCPHASNVAGYGTWKKLGRHVKAHEVGIQILAPCGFRAVQEVEKIDPVTGQTLYGPDGSPLKEKKYLSPNRFKIAHVFDLSQTEGKELPRLGVYELSGDVADYSGIYNRLSALSPLPVMQESFEGGAKGYTSFSENRVVIRPGMSQVQTIKTLVHEIAHAKLHKPSDILGEEPPQSRRQKEVEAESMIGWDSRWGTIQKVWATGSPTTGTYRPYGLDCSGFMDWIFYNISNGSYVLGHGGGAHAQHGYCQSITWDEAQPGDLVFYPEDTHVGIVGGWDDDGNILIIHCASGQNNVVITGKAGFTTIGRPQYYSE